MEVYIVLAHELIEMDVLRIEPPLLPLGCEIRGNAKVTDRGLKLDIG